MIVKRGHEHQWISAGCPDAERAILHLNKLEGRTSIVRMKAGARAPVSYPPSGFGPVTLGARGDGEAVNSPAGIGTRNPLASSGVAANHASRLSGGTMTSERFSSLGAWKRPMTGWSSGLIVSMEKLCSPSPVGCFQ